MRLLLLLGLACCGRLGFDPSQTALDGSLVDATSDSSSPTPALVQAQSTFASAATIGLPIEPTQQGSLLVVLASGDSIVESINMISDDAGNVYASANVLAQTPGLIANAEIWYATSAKPGATLVSVTSQASVMRGLWFIEIGGAPDLVLDGGTVLDDGMQVTNAVTGPMTTPSSVPAVIVTLVVVSANINALTTPSHFIGLAVEHGDDAAYALVATPGAYNAVWDATGTGPYCGAVATFVAH